MKKRAIVLLVVFAVAALAAAGLAACGDGDWLEGTYEYSKCSIDYDANIDLGGMDMEAIMGDTYEKMLNGATMTFEKDKVTVNMAGVNSARYTSIEADTSTWEFSVTWKFYINDTVSFDMDDVVMKEGTFSGTLPKLRNAYNENFARQVLWEYNAGFAAQALQDASEEEIAAYKEPAAEYQITPPAGL